MHQDVDQLLRIEDGKKPDLMGDSEDELDVKKHVEDDDVIMVQAVKWHNHTNEGDMLLKVYSNYAPAAHPYGTVQKTRTEAMAAEEEHNH